MPRPTTTVLAALAAALVAVLPVAPAVAAVTPSVGVAAGHDVSYPQCGGSLPVRGDIAVVGVNAGTGTTTNPCLAEQLAWGDAGGRLADVYVNTANPGHIGGWWPGADLTRAGLPVDNPEGSCVGAEDAACAYVYGYSVAADDLGRGVPRAADRTWWLDVETMNTWSWSRPANLAVLEGMTAALRSAGAAVGVYSTTRQWSIIVGTATATSSLAGTPSWVAGAVTREGALQQCAAEPFAAGGRVAMVQWVEAGRDRDLACAPSVRGSEPDVAGDAVEGGVLSAETGRWGPSGIALTFQWLRDGEPIPGATGSTMRVTTEDVGTAIAVRVTGTGTGQGGATPAIELTSPAVVPEPRPTPTDSPTPALTPVPTRPAQGVPGLQV